MLTQEQRSTYRAFSDSLVDYALSQGCAQVRIELNHIEHFCIDTHNHHVDTLQQSTGVGLTVRLFVDGRYGSYSTNRMDRSEVEGLIKRGIDATQHLSVDACRTLPLPERYYRSPAVDLNDLGCYHADISSTDLDTKKAWALEAACCQNQADERIISLDTSLQDRIGWQYLTDSNGFHGESGAGICSLVASVNLQGDGDCRPSDYEHLTAVSYADLQRKLQARTVQAADAAFNRTVRKIGERSIEAGTYTLVVEPRIVGKLLDPMIDVLFGANLYQQRSFLADKLGKVVASPLLTLTDEPLRYGASGACRFDYEGVATQPTDIYRDGRLSTFFIDTYYANKLQQSPTSSGPAVLCMKPGRRSQADIVADMQRGILLTGFNGGNYNEVTGDYSFGIEGILIENGVLTTPISEMNLTGNLLDLWQHLVEVGNETEQTAAGFIPSLVFEGGKIG